MWKRTYDISLFYHYGVCIYSGSRGQIEIFVRETSHLWHCIFRRSFCFLGANYCSFFYHCSSFGTLGEVFVHGGEFPLAFLIVTVVIS